MRPQMIITILASALGLSVAMNVSLGIGCLHRADTSNECMLDKLQMDAAQRERLSEMRRKMQDKRAAFWRHSAAIKAELAEAICASSSSHTRLDPLLDRFAENQAGMQRAVAGHLSEVNAMLRPDQQEAFRVLLRTEMFRGIRTLPAGAADRP